MVEENGSLNNPVPTEKLVGPHNEGDSLLRTIIEDRMEERRQEEDRE